MDQDLQILFHARIGFGGQARFELLLGGLKVGQGALASFRARDGDLFVQPGNAAGASAFGRIAGANIDQQLRVLVALDDPGRRSLCRQRQSDQWQNEENRKTTHPTSSIEART